MAGSGDGGHEREVLEDSINHSGSFSRHRYRRSMSSGEEDKGLLAFSGWVYHIGTNSIGHEYCHQRFLYVKGKYVEMYRRDPQENPGIVRNVNSSYLFSVYCSSFGLFRCCSILIIESRNFIYVVIGHPSVQSNA